MYSSRVAPIAHGHTGYTGNSHIVNIGSMGYSGGMPRESTHPHKRLLQLDDELKGKIEEFRYSERFPTEAAAIRELIRRGLEASANPKKKR